MSSVNYTGWLCHFDISAHADCGALTGPVLCVTCSLGFCCCISRQPNNRPVESILSLWSLLKFLSHSGSLPFVLLLPHSFHLDTRGMSFVFTQLDVYQLH